MPASARRRSTTTTRKSGGRPVHPRRPEGCWSPTLGEPFVSDYGRPDRRLRVIYDNGTESDLLLRSLQRALNKDKASRRITEPDFGPLFSRAEEEDDLATGYIYVLRSKSDHPFVAEHRSVIHKIGVTGGDVKSRDRQREKRPDLSSGRRGNRRDIQAGERQPQGAGGATAQTIRRCPTGSGIEGSIRRASGAQGVVSRPVAGDRRGDPKTQGRQHREFLVRSRGRPRRGA